MTDIAILWVFLLIGAFVYLFSRIVRESKPEVSDDNDDFSDSKNDATLV